MSNAKLIADLLTDCIHYDRGMYTYLGITFTFVVHDEQLELAYLRNRNAGNGNGKRFMQLLCSLCDRYCVELILLPHPMPRQFVPLIAPMSLSNLQSWYNQFGLEILPSGYMLRKPTCESGNPPFRDNR